MEEKFKKKNGFWTFVKLIGFFISISPFLFFLYSFLSDDYIFQDGKLNPPMTIVFAYEILFGFMFAVMALGIVIFNVARLNERE